MKNSLNINTIDFGVPKFAVYTPTDYKSDPLEVEPLAQGLKEKTKEETQGIINTKVFSDKYKEIYPELAANKENYEYLTELTNKNLNKVKVYLDLNDPENANRYASIGIRDIDLDAKLNAMKHRSKQYNSYKEKIEKLHDNHQLSDRMYNYYLNHVNQYSNEYIRDDNGNIIGGKDWKPDHEVIDEFNAIGASIEAKKVIAELKGSTSKTTNIDPKTKEIVETTTERSSSYQQLKQEQIFESADSKNKNIKEIKREELKRFTGFINGMFESNTEVPAQLRAGLEATLKEIETLEKELENPNLTDTEKQLTQDKLNRAKKEIDIDDLFVNGALDLSNDKLKLYMVKKMADADDSIKELCYNYITSSRSDIGKVLKDSGGKSGRYNGKEATFTLSEDASKVIVQYENGGTTVIGLYEANQLISKGALQLYE